MRKRQVRSEFWESAILKAQSVLFDCLSHSPSILLSPSHQSLSFLFTFSLSFLSFSNYFMLICSISTTLHMYCYYNYDILSWSSLRLATLILFLLCSLTVGVLESWKYWTVCSKAPITTLFSNIILALI